MTFYLRSFASLSTSAALICFALALPGVSVLKAEAQPDRTNALYILTLPSDYKALENLIMSFKDSAANTLIIRPVSNEGNVDKKLLSKAVFFSHAQGIKVFVILPTRALTGLLEEHPDWEDMQYDLQSGTIQPTGKIDLFNETASAYLSDFFRDIAGYSVDGILLDDDFYYGEREGMSDQALEFYKQRYGSSFSARAAFKKVKEDGQQNLHEEYGKSFWNFAELKKERLHLFFKEIVGAAHTVNKEIRFGIPLHIAGLFVNETEMLARYSLDVAALQKMDTNLFWIAIRHRDIRAQQDITYKKSIQIVSRIVKTSLSLIKDPAKVIIAIQTTTPTGKVLPISEIEEVSFQTKKTGEPGIAFMVEPDTALPAMLTKKIFKQLQE